MEKITNKNIEQATDLLPYVIAELVAEKTLATTMKAEMAGWDKLDADGKKALDEKYKKEKHELIEYLVLRAETTFQYSETFNKKVNGKGNKGRDHLYLFMYHWSGWHGETLLNWQEYFEGKIAPSYKKSIENYYRDMNNFAKQAETKLNSK